MLSRIITAGAICLLLKGDSLTTITDNCCGRCVGSAYCRACTTCNYCRHCNSGGSCGVCGGGRIVDNIWQPPKEAGNSNPRVKKKIYKWLIKTRFSNVRKGPGLEYRVSDKLMQGKIVYIQSNQFPEWPFVVYYRKGIRRKGYIFIKNLLPAS